MMTQFLFQNAAVGHSMRDSSDRHRSKVGELLEYKKEDIKAFAFHSNTGVGSAMGSIRLGAHKR